MFPVFDYEQSTLYICNSVGYTAGPPIAESLGIHTLTLLDAVRCYSKDLFCFIYPQAMCESLGCCISSVTFVVVCPFHFSCSGGREYDIVVLICIS